MGLSRLAGDARGDSSTIGVVLMIGVAVVLAAVTFGSFAGMGQQSLSDTPELTVSVEYDQGAVGGFGQTDDDGGGEAVVVTHERGDEVKFVYVEVLVDGEPVRDGSNTLAFDGSPPPTLSAGDSLRVVNAASTDVLAPGSTVLVRYENPDEERSLVLYEGEIP
jgi:FlaG/FlaF family flagellin (archaellin)